MPDNNELHIAAKKGDLVLVQSQLSNFDINAKGEEDGTALYWSARNGHAEIVKLLLTFNADVNIPDVRAFKIISVDLIFIFPIPLPLFYTLLSKHADTYCYLSYPITLSSRYSFLQFTVFNITSCLRCHIPPSLKSLLLSFRFSLSLGHTRSPSLFLLLIIPLLLFCPYLHYVAYTDNDSSWNSRIPFSLCLF